MARPKIEKVIIFRGSSTVEQIPVKDKVAGSNPARGATLCQGYGVVQPSHVVHDWNNRDYAGLFIAGG